MSSSISRRAYLFFESLGASFLEREEDDLDFGIRANSWWLKSRRSASEASIMTWSLSWSWSGFLAEVAVCWTKSTTMLSEPPTSLIRLSDMKVRTSMSVNEM